MARDNVTLDVISAIARPARLLVLLLVGAAVAVSCGGGQENLLSAPFTAQVPGGLVVMQRTMNGTQLSVTLRDLTLGTHASHVHHDDSCLRPEVIELALNEVVARPDELELAYQLTEIRTPSFDHFLDDRHVVDVHRGPDANPGVVIACGLLRTGDIE